jgi:hypothetical protein
MPNKNVQHCRFVNPEHFDNDLRSVIDDCVAHIPGQRLLCSVLLTWDDVEAIIELRDGPRTPQASALLDYMRTRDICIVVPASELPDDE